MPTPVTPTPLTPAAQAPLPADVAAMLPHPSPDDEGTRMLLIAARRMAVHGLHDASAAMLMLRTYGIHFRKPLVLLRAFLMEASQGARRDIRIAPCCMPRLTAHEGAMLMGLANARHNGALASAYLAQFNGQAVNAALLATARALSHSLADIGRAIDYAPDVEF